MACPTLASIPSDVLRLIVKLDNTVNIQDSTLFTSRPELDILVLLVLSHTSRDLRDNVSHIKPNIHRLYSHKLAYIAGTTNSLSLIKWLTDLGLPFFAPSGNKCPAAWACCGAAWAGNVDLLQDLHDMKYPVDVNVAKDAVIGNNFYIMAWLMNNNYPIRFWGTNYYLRDHMIVYGRVDMLRLTELCNDDTDDACLIAATWGQIDVLEYILNECISGTFFDGILTNAAICGRINVLEWALRKGFVFTSSLCYYVAKNRKTPDVLTWFRDNGCPWDNRVCKDTFAIKKIN